MKESSKRRVYSAIKKHGDSFWNDASEENAWNGFLFDGILNMLEKEGLDLELIENES